MNKRTPETKPRKGWIHILPWAIVVIAVFIGSAIMLAPTAYLDGVGAEPAQEQLSAPISTPPAEDYTPLAALPSPIVPTPASPAVPTVSAAPVKPAESQTPAPSPAVTSKATPKSTPKATPSPSPEVPNSTATVAPDESATQEGSSRYPAITADEREMIAALVYLEARGEPFSGQQAVAEVVLNRVISGRFPDTVSGVIYASGQFTPAKRIASTTPTQTQYDAVDAALNGPNILPTNVVYFSTSAENSRVWGKIGHHVFCYI